MSPKSATVFAFGDYRTKHRTVYFTRFELNQLLGLYSRHVARGVWRDYAIDHRDGMAQFSVFRHTRAGTGAPGRVFRTKRAATASRFRQPYRCPGVLSNAPQRGRHRNRLAGAAHREHPLDPVASDGAMKQRTGDVQPDE